MKPVASEVQVANMSEPVSKSLETAGVTSTTVTVKEISETSDVATEREQQPRKTETATANMKTPVANDIGCSEVASGTADRISETSDMPNEADKQTKKKKGRRTNWTSVPLEFPPHRPPVRGKSRRRGRGQGSTSNAEEREQPRERKSAEVSAQPETQPLPIGTRGRGSGRGGRRSGRGRGQQSFRDQDQGFPSDPSRQLCYYSVGPPPMWHVYKLLKEQVEFYFYNPKLAEDFYLRRNMDALGFVELSKIATFDQVGKIAQGLHDIVGLLVQALQPSELLELSADKKCVRRKFSPEKWILGNDPAVFSTLRADAPEFVFEPNNKRQNEKKDDAKEIAEPSKSADDEAVKSPGSKSSQNADSSADVKTNPSRNTDIEPLINTDAEPLKNADAKPLNNADVSTIVQEADALLDSNTVGNKADSSENLENTACDANVIGDASEAEENASPAEKPEKGKVLQGGENLGNVSEM